MSQNDFVIDNGTGAQVRHDINSALQALATLSSGPSAPGTTYPYQFWADTTNGILKRRNAANSGWVVLAPLASTMVQAKSANYTVLLSDYGTLIDCTNTITIALTAAATLGDGFWFAVRNSGSGIVTIDPSGAETIDGAATIALGQGDSAIVWCNGTTFKTVGRGGAQLDAANTFTADQTIQGAVVVGSPTGGNKGAGKINAEDVLINGEPARVLVQRAYAEYTQHTSITAVIPADDTVPQITEGTQLLQVSITPKSASNRIRIRFHAPVFLNNGAVAAALFRNGTTNAIATGAINVFGNISSLYLEYEDTPGSTDEQTYSIRIGPSGGTMYVNGTSLGRFYGGTLRAMLVAEEIKA